MQSHRGKKPGCLARYAPCGPPGASGARGVDPGREKMAPPGVQYGLLLRGNAPVAGRISSNSTCLAQLPRLTTSTSFQHHWPQLP
eukprot:scaffold3100_cov110-Isochrysis_galbana.AAC.3